MGAIKRKRAAMSSARVNNLRKKFMWISMASFLIVMLFTGCMVNFAFSHATRKQMDMVLDELIENEGVLTIREEFENQTSTIRDQMFNGMRYFTVIFDLEEDGEETINLEHVRYMDTDKAKSLALTAKNSFFEVGVLGDYYYKVGETGDGRTIVAFVNSSIQMQIRHQVIRYTVFICAVGLLLTGIVMWLLSKRAIRSEIETIERQKEFITNASHELKTPLAVIRANTEILEMTAGESEWTASTLRQVEHMNGLIQNLVMIARSAEQEGAACKDRTNFSKIVGSVVEPFRSVAIQEEKELTVEAEEELYVRAEESALRQLVSILTDNAIKYCDPKGSIAVKLTKGRRGRTVSLSVSNSFQDGAKVDCQKFFDRFYREDSSHKNQQGYGIGLSMAESICRQYRGKIWAEWKDGVITFTCVLPTA